MSKQSLDDSCESVPVGFEDVVHWVHGKLWVRPDYKLQADVEARRSQPWMTELQIQHSWGVLSSTLGIGLDTRLLEAGKAMLAALEAGDGRAALVHYNEAWRLDPVAAEELVRDTRRNLEPGEAAARWLFATRRAQEMLAALEAGDHASALENLRAASRVEPGVVARHVRAARERGLL